MTTTSIQATTITVKVDIAAPIEKVWASWTLPEHITQWNAASDDWHTPSATNDLRDGGTFTSRMEAKDGSFGFDFEGTYTLVKTHRAIEYLIADGRKVQIQFEKTGAQTTKVIETFEAETENSIELQQSGWQAILDNFKAYTEKH